MKEKLFRDLQQYCVDNKIDPKKGKLALRQEHAFVCGFMALVPLDHVDYQSIRTLMTMCYLSGRSLLTLVHK